MRRTLALMAIAMSVGCDSPTEPDSPTDPLPAILAVKGTVLDVLDRRVANVRIEVVKGPQTGTVTFSDDAGNFAIEPKLSPMSQIRASKQGYINGLQTVGGSAPTVDLKFVLSSANAPLNWSGTYDVTFTADATCVDLPDLARQRTFSANVSSMVVLSGATFGSSDGYVWNTMYLGQVDDYVVLWAQEPPIVEMLQDNAYYMVYGDAKGTVTREFAQLNLGGDIGYCPKLGAGSLPSLPCEVPMIRCRSVRHQMTMTRR
jgi:hypothetical protein